jgi:hypothetical protein
VNVWEKPAARMDLGAAVAHIRRDEDRAMSRIADEVGFVHLRVHSAFSLLEGALPLKKLVKLAGADRMPALGIADTGNLYGALEYSAKMAEAASSRSSAARSRSISATPPTAARTASARSS